jgi:hypothetical protein
MSDSDERTIATQQRWAARGMWMLSFALSIDVLVRILILKQEPRQYLDIFLIWMVTMLCAAIGMTASGVAPYGGKWSAALAAILVIAVVCPAVLVLMGMVRTPGDFIADMVGAVVGAFVALIILRAIYSLWERVTLGRLPREE